MSDAHDGAPMDVSDAPFTIVSPAISTQQAFLDFVQVPIGAAGVETLRVVNGGTATLVISSVSVAGNGPFTPTRTSFSIPAGASDTLAVVFEPIAAEAYEDTLLIASNAPGSPTRIPLAGKGTSPVGVSPSDLRAPARFEMRDNAPNPFGAAGTMIVYALPRESDVSLVVYNVLGQAVATLVKGRQGAGYYAVRFPGAGPTLSRGFASTLPSGVYFCRLRAGAFEARKRMVMVR